jgi:archaellum component FlaF (FlaF/FlaG flagellin family)
MRIAVFVFQGVEELAFVGVYEVLTKAEEMRKDKLLNIHESIEVEIVAFNHEITCAHAMVVKVHRDLRWIRKL